MNKRTKINACSLTIVMHIFSLCGAHTHSARAVDHYTEEVTTTQNALSFQKKALPWFLKGLGIGGLSLLGVVVSYHIAQKLSSELAKHNKTIINQLSTQPVARDTSKTDKPKIAPALEQPLTEEPGESTHQTSISPQGAVHITIQVNGSLETTTTLETPQTTSHEIEPPQSASKNILKITISPSKKPLNTPTLPTGNNKAHQSPEVTTKPRSPERRRLDFDAPLQTLITVELPKTTTTKGLSSPIKHRPSLPLNLMQQLTTPCVKLRPRSKSLSSTKSCQKTVAETLKENITERRKFIVESPYQEAESPLNSPAGENTTFYKTPPRKFHPQITTTNAASIASKAKNINEKLKKISTQNGSGTITTVESLITAKSKLRKPKEKKEDAAPAHTLNHNGNMFNNLQKDVADHISTQSTSPESPWD